MLEEILQLGLTHVELGYDLSLALVPGVKKFVEDGSILVDSVHAFCPVPSYMPYGHPELFSLTATDRAARERAVIQIAETVHFASEVRAPTVVLHGGRIEMKNLTQRLIHIYKQEGPYSTRFEKTKAKLVIRRDRKIKKHLENLYMGLESLIPTLESARIRLALECLPSWESIPSENEMMTIIEHFQCPWLAYWHDIGHGYTRQCLGFGSTQRWLERLQGNLAGFHVHDVQTPATDHIMPPEGDVDFSIFRPYAAMNIPAVLEPCPGFPAEGLATAMGILSEIWNIENPAKNTFATPGKAAK
jgi:sugar phosphate isomerase/epimerase